MRLHIYTVHVATRSSSAFAKIPCYQVVTNQFSPLDMCNNFCHLCTLMQNLLSFSLAQSPMQQQETVILVLKYN